MKTIIGNVITLLPLTLVIFLILSDKYALKSKSSKHFLFALLIAAMESLLDIILVTNTANTVLASSISLVLNCLYFIFMPFLGYNLVVLAIVNTSFEKYQNLFKVPLIINTGLSISSLWTGLFFTVNSVNQYFRGPLYLVQFIINISYLIFFLFMDLKKLKKYQFDDKVCFFLNYSIMMTSMFFQLIHVRFVLVWPTVSISLIFYYIIYLNQNLRCDVLTGLLSRRIYERDLDRFNGRKPVTIINIDINSFKNINDNSGHSFGDGILKKTAAVVQKHFSPYGFSYRVGGDEFCVILDTPLPISIASVFNAIEEELALEKANLKIPKLLSYGYYEYTPKKDKNIYEAVKVADNYMYNFKNRYKTKIINM